MRARNDGLVPCALWQVQRQMAQINDADGNHVHPMDVWRRTFAFTPNIGARSLARATPGLSVKEANEYLKEWQTKYPFIRRQGAGGRVKAWGDRGSRALVHAAALERLGDLVRVPFPTEMQRVWRIYALWCEHTSQQGTAVIDAAERTGVGESLSDARPAPPPCPAVRRVPLSLEGSWQRATVRETHSGRVSSGWSVLGGDCGGDALP